MEAVQDVLWKDVSQVLYHQQTSVRSMEAVQDVLWKDVRLVLKGQQISVRSMEAVLDAHIVSLGLILVAEIPNMTAIVPPVSSVCFQMMNEAR
jgi:hypothetical protein